MPNESDAQYLRRIARTMDARAKQAEERVVAALQRGALTTSAAQDLVGHLVARVYESATAHHRADVAELVESGVHP